MMKAISRIVSVILLRGLAAFLCACSLSAGQIGPLIKLPRVKDDQILFQVSTLNALALGIYQGAYSIGGLKEHRNFGLGTFEGIDGELTVLDRMAA
jgi:Alpha-acetolactate decarboxylase